MADPEIKSPSEYAVLPAGTEVRYGQKGATIATAALLQSAMGIGATGKKGTFLEVTRLIDTEPKYMADISPRRSRGFLLMKQDKKHELQIPYQPTEYHR